MVYAHSFKNYCEPVIAKWTSRQSLLHAMVWLVNYCIQAIAHHTMAWLDNLCMPWPDAQCTFGRARVMKGYGNKPLQVIWCASYTAATVQLLHQGLLERSWNFGWRILSNLTRHLNGNVKPALPSPRLQVILSLRLNSCQILTPQHPRYPWHLPYRGRGWLLSGRGWLPASIASLTSWDKQRALRKS